MIEPLDLTVIAVESPSVDLDLRTIVVPSTEAPLSPLWATEAELSAGKRLISMIEEEPREEAALVSHENAGVCATFIRWTSLPAPI